jgi:hypothetical protein
MSAAGPRSRTVVALGLAQMLAWGSTYYLPAMLAAPMARDLGTTAPTVFAGFSAALGVSALVGPASGRAIDRWGGRPVLLATSLVFALGLAGLGAARGLTGHLLGWLVLGLGMGSGLYESAFAALVRLHGQDARRAITGVALFGGLASTVGWPLTALLEAQVGWRGACFAWAGLHLLIGLPLNACLPRVGHAALPGRRPDDAGARPSPPGVPVDEDPGPRDPRRLPTPASVPPQALAVDPATAAPDDRANGAPARGSPPARTAWLLAFVFAVTWFISTAMAAHLPRLLQASGVGLAAAVGVAALVGPAQVAGRLAEFGFLRRLHPLLSARLAALMHPLGALALLLMGAPAAAVFAVVHGLGNGILTIAKGTLPLVLFGAHGYGQRQGVLMVPARLAQALAPWVFGLGLDRWGAASLGLTALLGLAAFAALMALDASPPAVDGPAH